MPAITDRPLLTFSVGAYNQERFIRQAVEGAFAQTYSPLQIILSDDCSRDRTYEIMSEMAAAYRGPHQIVLNRNPRNLGLVGHVNRLAELMRGELMVMCAGDDIPVPNRTEALGQAWEASNRKACCLHSRVIHIDENYRGDGPPKPQEMSEADATFEDGPSIIKSYLRSTGPVVLGCTAAFSRNLFDCFGPLPENVVFEDMALTFRAMLSGGLTFINRPLVLYRLHSSNLHHSKAEFVRTMADLLADEERKKTMLKRKLSVAKSFRRDLERAKELGIIEPPDQAVLVEEVRGFEEQNEWELDYRSANFFRRFALFMGRPDYQQASPAGSERMVFRLMPRWCYYSMRILKNRMRGLTTRG
jgi:glycosyltransferase involved in cell wall biosynthesis